MPTFLVLTWVLFFGGLGALLFSSIMRQRNAIDAWSRTPAGKRHKEAMESWLLCKARVERAEPTGEPPVMQAETVFRRGNDGRLRNVYVHQERRPMRVQVRLLPIGGGEVVTEDVIPIITAEIGDLTPGRIFSVLYDPGDPQRFWIDTTRRDETLIDAVTMRTRAAEENLRAAQAFSNGQG